MNVRMTGGMPPMGSNGMGPPRGAPMGPPPAMQMGMPMGPQSAPQPIPQGGMPQQSQPPQMPPQQMPPQQGGLGSVGGSAEGRQGFYQYMRGRKEQQMQMQQMRQQQMPIQPQMSMGPFGGPPPQPPMMPNAPVNMGLGAQMPSSGVSSAPQQFMYGGYVDPRRMMR